MSPPTILIVPGFWEGPAPFAQVRSLLEADGFPTEIAPLLSTGKTSPGNPSMLDDIAAVRAVVTKLVESGKKVILVMHSAGGFVGSNAIEGLGLEARGNIGGGVAKLVFLAGAVFPEGFKHGPLPFMEFDEGAMHCKSPKALLFNDLDPFSAENWQKMLQPQPSKDWDDTVTYCGWKDVPSTYLLCENDQVIPAQMQHQLAGLAGSVVETCGAGHMSFLSMPEKVAGVIKSAGV